MFRWGGSKGCGTRRDLRQLAVCPGPRTLSRLGGCKAFLAERILPNLCNLKYGYLKPNVDKYMEIDISLDEGDYFRPLWAEICGAAGWFRTPLHACVPRPTSSRRNSLFTILPTKTFHSPTGPKICDEKLWIHLHKNIYSHPIQFRQKRIIRREGAKYLSDMFALQLKPENKFLSVSPFAHNPWIQGMPGKLSDNESAL
jgi:hypothetical protein